MRLVNRPAELKTDNARHDEAKAEQTRHGDCFAEEEYARSSYQGSSQTRPDGIGDADVDRPEHVGEQDTKERE